MSGPVTPVPNDRRAHPEPGALAASAVDAGPAPRPPSSARTNRYLPGLATAIVPGLGHLLDGRRRAGALFLAPVLVAAAGLAVPLATTSRGELLARLVDPAVLDALLAAQIALLVWRLLALASSIRGARPYRGADALPIALLIAFVVVPQAYLGYATDVARQTAESVFQPVGGAVWRPSPQPTGDGAVAPSANPASPPAATATRLTVLLIGMDSGVGRQTALTDTMIVASLDPVGQTVSMLSVPRDLVDAPLPTGGVFHPKINSLATYAQLHPAEFPGSNGDGEAVLAGTLSELLGIPIDYWAQVNLGGFLRLVDTVGGVDVNVAHGFCDPRYDEYGQTGFAIAAGRWHLNGSQALAYARVRKAAGESDFTRAARQQEVLVGLRDQVVRGSFLNDPIGFLQAIGTTVRTNVPPSLLPKVARYAGEIGRNRVYRAVIQYPLVHPTAVPDPRGSIQIPDIPAIRALVAGLFPTPGTAPVVGGSSTSPIESPDSGSSPSDATPAGAAPRPGSTTCHAVATPRPSASPSSDASPSTSANPSSSGEPSADPSPSPGGGSPPSGSTPDPTTDTPAPGSS